MLIWLD